MNGNIYQYFVNLPFGETMAEQTSSGYFQSPWKFNGKELDAETGLYYYGARYYYPRLSNWLSVDPLAEKYPGVTPYAYCFNNPVKYLDPDGMGPIYAKNFWGNVRLIGDDGQKSTGSYLVRGSIARKVKAATKAGEFYTGSLAENKNVMRIPTGQIQQDVQQTATATINSGATSDTRVENGGHTLKGDLTARIWDSGTPAKTSPDAEGNTIRTWSITPFKIGGKRNQVGGPLNSIQDIWHIHPKGSDPSPSDFDVVSDWRSHGFTGNTFLIDVNINKVTFFNEKGVLIKVNYNDFIKMGNQEGIK